MSVSNILIWHSAVRAGDVSCQELGIVLVFLSHSVQATRGKAHRRLMGASGEEGPNCQRNGERGEMVGVPSPAPGCSPSLRTPVCGCSPPQLRTAQSPRF